MLYCLAIDETQLKKMNLTIQPLQGLRVLNTRPIHQAQALTQAIQTLGGQVVHCPALHIMSINVDWEARCEAPSCYDIMIFISANAVHYYFERRPSEPWPMTLLTLAIGDATALALQKKRIIALQPEESHSEGLLRLPCLQHIHQKKIALIKGIGGRTVLDTTLSQRGASVQSINVYQRTQAKMDPHLIERIWRDDQIDIILFTSQQAMEHLFALFGQEALAWLQRKPCLVISQRLVDIAKEMGIKTAFLTSPNQLPQGLIEAYASLKREKKELQHD